MSLDEFSSQFLTSRHNPPGRVITRTCASSRPHDKRPPTPAPQELTRGKVDGRRQIIIKANGGETVDAAPGFYTVAGHNPGVHGAVLSDALASRFSVQIQVSTDYDLATQLKIDTKAVAVARNLATRQANGEIRWAPQLRELLAFQKVADVLGMDAAAGNLIGTAPEEDRDIVATAVRTAFGKAVAPLALGARI